MRIIIFASAILLQLQWSYGTPAGVGAYAYQDTAGNRYGGTYDLNDGQVFNFNGDDATTFGPNSFHDFQDIDSFFPEYFRNLENLIQDVQGVGSLITPFGMQRGRFGGLPPLPPMPKIRAFANSADEQKKALGAARKAFDLTSTHAGYVPNLENDINRFSDVPNFGFQQPNFNMPNFNSPFMQPFAAMPMAPMPNFGSNSAFAGAAVGPGYRRQMVALNPENPGMRNIDVTQYSDSDSQIPNRGGFYSVSSSSFVSSSNKDGKQTSQRLGETVVNDNGKITKYSLNN